MKINDIRLTYLIQLDLSYATNAFCRLENFISHPSESGDRETIDYHRVRGRLL